MNIATFSASQSQDVINLFATAFSESEGQDEGELIAVLVSDLIVTTDEHDIVGFVAVLKKNFWAAFSSPDLHLRMEKLHLSCLLSPVSCLLSPVSCLLLLSLQNNREKE